jgi:hypothetical protein
MILVLQVVTRLAAQIALCGKWWPKRIHDKAGRNESRRNYNPGVRKGICSLASRGGNGRCREQGGPKIGMGTRMTDLLGRGQHAEDRRDRRDIYETAVTNPST